MLSYMIFVAVATWKVILSDDAIQSSASFFDYMTYDGVNNATAVTRVLVVRTMSPSEVSIVIDDIMYVKSFYAGEHESWMAKSRSRCPELREAGYASTIDAYANGTQTFPNHLLCHADATTEENHYLAVRADFMLFARNEAMAQNVSKTISELSQRTTQTTSLYEVDVDIRDVSLNPHKIWNWLFLCTAERLAGYDYVWFIDGDVSLRSLNWQAFWQQVKLLRPKITQGGSISSSPEGYSSVHGVLRYNPDARLMAAEVPILEVQAPLVEVPTWLAYRDFLANDPKPMARFEVGGEQCFDMAWCHHAKNNMTGIQGDPPIKNIGYHSQSPELSPGDNGDARGRACMVLYQTPILHVSRYSRKSHIARHDFNVASQLLCRYFRLDLGVVGKQGLKGVYEKFNAPKS